VFDVEDGVLVVDGEKMLDLSLSVAVGLALLLLDAEAGSWWSLCWPLLLVAGSAVEPAFNPPNMLLLWGSSSSSVYRSSWLSMIFTQKYCYLEVVVEGGVCSLIVLTLWLHVIRNMVWRAKPTLEKARHVQ